MQKRPLLSAFVVLTALLSFVLGGLFQHHTNFLGVSSPEQAPRESSKKSGADKKANNQTTPSLDELRSAVPGWVSTVRKEPDKKAIGNPDAPVTIVEYLDFQCPFCRKHVEQNMERIVRDFVESGTVYYKVRHFPLASMHPQATMAANASECAADQDSFWAFKSVAMQYQQHFNKSFFLKLGKALGLQDKYRKCVRESKHMDIVKKEYREGEKRGVKATPTLFINDKKVPGAPPPDLLNKLIKQQLQEGSYQGQ